MSAKEEGDKAYMEFNKSRPLSRLMEGEKTVRKIDTSQTEKLNIHVQVNTKISENHSRK